MSACLPLWAYGGGIGIDGVGVIRSSSLTIWSLGPLARTFAPLSGSRTIVSLWLADSLGVIRSSSLTIWSLGRSARAFAAVSGSRTIVSLWFAESFGAIRSSSLTIWSLGF